MIAKSGLCTLFALSILNNLILSTRVYANKLSISNGRNDEVIGIYNEKKKGTGVNGRREQKLKTT